MPNELGAIIKMPRHIFHNDDVCASVARVFWNRYHRKKPMGWPAAGSPESIAECDWFIDRVHSGDVKAAHDAAYDYLADDSISPG